MGKTLEQSFTQEDIDRVANLIQESEKLIRTLDANDEILDRDFLDLIGGTKAITYLIGDLKPYANDKNAAGRNITILIKKYEKATGEEYQPTISN
mgnify:CR=1 FL=1